MQPGSVPLGWTRPRLIAKVTGLSFPKQKSFGLSMVTVRFTIGEAGKSPGTGITFGSTFLVHIASKTGALSRAVLRSSTRLARPLLSDPVPLPRGGIGGVEVAGWINVRRDRCSQRRDVLDPVVVHCPAPLRWGRRAHSRIREADHWCRGDRSRSRCGRGLGRQGALTPARAPGLRSGGRIVGKSDTR